MEEILKKKDILKYVKRILIFSCMLISHLHKYTFKCVPLRVWKFTPLLLISEKAGIQKRKKQ